MHLKIVVVFYMTIQRKNLDANLAVFLLAGVMVLIIIGIIILISIIHFNVYQIQTLKILDYMDVNMQYLIRIQGNMNVYNAKIIPKNFSLKYQLLSHV